MSIRNATTALLLSVISATVPAFSAATESAPPPTFLVDTKLRPSKLTIAGRTGPMTRQIARVIDRRGHYADFVENEILVFSNDQAQVAALAARWHGTIVSNAKFPKDLGKTLDAFLVTIDSTLANPANMAIDLRKKDPTSTGDIAISSVVGLQTMAAAAHEFATTGIPTGANYLFRLEDLANWSTSESNMGGAAGDAFQEPYLCDVAHIATPGQCVQNIGVGKAWRALKYAGKLENRVDVTIWDSGFDPHNDFPAQYTVNPANTLGQPGPGTCEGQDCPFHGTNVVTAGFGRADNGFGDAGPGGALSNVRVNMVSSPGLDLFGFLESLYSWVASLFDTQVLNISAMFDIPTPLCIGLCETMDLIAEGLHALNILVVAAAGNDGSNVDDSVWFVETAKRIPCEMSGVLCVGGIDWNSTAKAYDSAWGSDASDPNHGGSVRLFAPFTVWMYDAHGPSGDAPGMYRRSGTSYSAPFVAGVASMVLAANPNLNAGEVEDLLVKTATPSTDSTVHRYVNAFAAVRQALGGHTPPSIRIVSPALNTTFPAGSNVAIDAVATDEDTGADISSLIQWEGNFTTGSRLTMQPTPGTSSTVTAYVVYNTYRVSASVTFAVRDYVPTLTISALQNGALILSGAPYRVYAHAMKGPHDLSSTVAWTAVGGGKTRTGTGSAWDIPVDLMVPGYSLQLTAAIPGASQIITLLVVPDHPAPTANITKVGQFSPSCFVPAGKTVAPCTFSTTATAKLIGFNSNSLSPVYEASNIRLEGNAILYIPNHPPTAAAASNLTWYQDVPGGTALGTGGVFNGTVRVTRVGTPTNPVQLPIYLHVDDGNGQHTDALVILNVITVN